MYTYTYAVCVTCGEKNPLKVVMSLPYYTLIFRADQTIFHQTRVWFSQLAKDTEPNLFVLTEQRKYFNKAAKLSVFSPLSLFF